MNIYVIVDDLLKSCLSHQKEMKCTLTTYIFMRFVGRCIRDPTKYEFFIHLKFNKKAGRYADHRAETSQE